jgi:hypothetical protein
MSRARSRRQTKQIVGNFVFQLIEQVRECTLHASVERKPLATSRRSGVLVLGMVCMNRMHAHVLLQ